MARIDGGLVNAHTHLYSGLAPLGLPPLDPPPRDFRDILERRWWRMDRALDHDILRCAARFYVANALLAGTTVIIDHHESPNCIKGSLDVLADSCQELGIRALVGYGISERNGGEDEATAGLEENRRFIEKNKRKLVAGAVGMHASFTLGDESLRRGAELARSLRVPLHVHIAEDQADVEDARRRGHAGPLERLVALDALPFGAILAHGVHLTIDNVNAALDDAGAWLVHNPRSNENNGVGYARVLGLRDRVAIGTDGFASNMLDEYAALERIAQAEGDPDHRRIVHARREASARLAHDVFGACTGDLVEWDDRGGSSTVRNVSIAGREIVRRGVLLTADYDTICKEAERAANLLWARMRSMGDKS